MEQFLEIFRESPETEAQVRQWLKACEGEKKPGIIIHYYGDTAEISASILGLLANKALKVEVNQEALDRDFFILSISYTANSMNYHNHNGRFFTFDEIPRYKAHSAATMISELLNGAITITAKSA